MASEDEVAKENFHEFANKVIRSIAVRNANISATELVEVVV